MYEVRAYVAANKDSPNTLPGLHQRPVVETEEETGMRDWDTYTLLCMGCEKSPDEIQEYLDMVEAGEAETAEQYVREEEGTYNSHNGHFLCTDCYIKAGMPSSTRGWICP